jgi:hypothetical protein
VAEWFVEVKGLVQGPCRLDLADLAPDTSDHIRTEPIRTEYGNKPRIGYGSLPDISMLVPNLEQELWGVNVIT